MCRAGPLPIRCLFGTCFVRWLSRGFRSPYILIIPKYLACVIAIGCATVFGQTNEPLAYYPANGSGADISPNHHAANVGDYGVGNSAYETGKSKQGFSFDGVDKHLDLGDWFMQQSFTIGFWMKDNATAAAPQMDGAQVGGQYNFNKGTNYWEVRYTAAGGGHYQVGTNNGGTPISFSITAGAWHYVLLARSGLDLRVIVDGSPQSTSTGTAFDSFAFNEGIRLGSDRDGLHQWKGALDEIRLYDRALGSFEIAAVSKDGVDAVVSGTANPYLAGQPVGTAVDGDTAPAQAPLAIPVSGMQDLLISASGAVGTAGGIAAGTPNGGVDTSHAASNGIASYAGPDGALVGVFLSDAAPSGSAPGGLDYTASGTADPSTAYNSPLIGQVFFIGARQGDGVSAHFYAPQFATRLFLAVIDNGNSNNSGVFAVHVADSTAGGPYERVITGNSNIFRAPSSASSTDGFFPPSASFRAAAGRILTFAEVAGAVRIDAGTDNGGQGASGPDGGTYQAPVNVATSGGLSGFKASSTGALVGVFLAGNAAPSVTPPTLDFSAANATNFRELSPVVGQVFFIGDGLAADGTAQKFNVPATASNLFLGIADGSTSGGVPGGYANNDGQFDATFQLSGGGETGSAVLDISATDTTTGDPSGKTAYIGGDITYQFHWKNTGTATAHHLQVSATVPRYIEDQTNLVKQFTPAGNNLTFNTTYGHYVNPTSPTANDAKVVWDVADLAPGYSQSVELKVHLHPQVRNVQQIGLPNNYAVASTSGQPVAGATGFSSGAANLSVDVRSALRFTATPDVTTVAPGKYINYTLKLENLSPSAATAAAAVFTLPEFTRFVGFGMSNGVPLKDPAGTTTGGFAPHPGSADEVLVYFGSVPALKSVSVIVTVQAQWVDPSEVSGQKLALFDYGAAFLNGTNTTYFTDAIAHPYSTRYYDWLKNPNHSTDLTYGGKTPVTTQFSGSAGNGPMLAFTKSIKNDANDTLNDGLGNVVDTVAPGDIVTYLFLIANEGKSAAEDVDIQDAMPTSTSYISGSVKILNTTASAIASALQEPTTAEGTLDGRHVVFKGLHLAPHDFLVLQYQVKVASGAAEGSVLTTDSAVSPSTGQLVASSAHTTSSPHSVGGLTLNGPLEVRAKMPFAQPRIRPMLPNPDVSTDIAATRAALDKVYASDPDAKPLTDPNNPLSFIPGMDRYYIHYENLSGGAISNVDLVVPLPSHTAFYRARFVKLVANPVKNCDGNWPGSIIRTLPSSIKLPPLPVLSTGKSVTAHFDTLDKDAKGDLMVEVIITPDVIQKNGPFTRAASDADVVIHDNPVVNASHPHPVTRSAQAAIPRVKAAHRAVASLAADASMNLAATPAIPTVPEIGILKIAPTVVKAGGDIEFSFVVFNSGDTRTPSCNFQFVQPKGTTFVSETHTSSYKGKFVVDGVSAVPGTDLECFWDYIPAHSAVAITYTLKASGKANVPVTDLHDRVLMDYAGELDVTASPVGVVASNEVPVNANSSTFSVTGHTLHLFTVSGSPVAIIDLGNDRVVVNEPLDLYQARGTGGVTKIAFGRSRGVYVGPAASVGIGSTSAAYLIAHRAEGKLLAPLATSPATTLVPAACLGLVLPGQLASAAGAGVLPLPPFAKLISNDGGGVISNDGGSVVSNDGGSVVSNDGGSVVSNDGGSLIAQDGAGLINQDGAGLTSQTNTSALIAAGAGNLIAAGAGNLVKTGQGN